MNSTLRCIEHKHHPPVQFLLKNHMGNTPLEQQFFGVDSILPIETVWQGSPVAYIVDDHGLDKW